MLTQLTTCYQQRGEEVWDATSHTAKGHTFGAKTAAGSLTYYTPSLEVMGASISATATYDNAAGVTHASAKGVSLLVLLVQHIQLRLLTRVV